MGNRAVASRGFAPAAFIVLAALPAIATAPDESAGREHFFPLIADGRGFQSHLFVTNVSGAANRCTLALRGTGLDVSVFQANSAVAFEGDDVTINLGQAGESVTLATTGGQGLVFGYARLDCAEPAAARMLLSLSNSGTPFSLATLESSNSGTSFQFPVLPRFGRLAMVFSNEAEFESACAVELEDEAGASFGGGDVTVPAGSTALRFLDELIAIPSGFLAGKARVSCNRNVAALGVPLSGFDFTALSVTALDDSVEESAHVLPLIWDGDGFRSQLLLTNLAETANRCSVDIRGERLDAGRFGISAGASVSGSSIALDLAGKGDQASLISSGTSSLAYGYAAIECDGPVEARNLLTVDAGGELAGMAAVSSTRPADGMEFPVVPELGRLALVMNNEGESEASCAVEFSANGDSVADTGLFEIAGRSTLVRFLGDLLAIPDDFPRGTARLSCYSEVAATSLLVNDSIFAAIPPVIVPIPPHPESARIIPDNNLRRLISKQLGKVPGAPIGPADLSELRRLDARGAGIENLEGLQHAKGLTWLDLEFAPLDTGNGKRLSDLLPILGLSNLEYLDLSGNRLSGPIPPEIGQLGNLQFLSLRANQLDGNIPGELGRLSNLEFMDLSINQLSGPIPSEVGQLGNLQRLSLSNNQLTDSIPEELFELSSLQILELGDNELSGPIPAEISELGNLRVLQLTYNRLSGSVPGEIGQLGNLQRLFLRQNRLTGSIPEELFELSNLRILSLGENELSGPIPAAIGELGRLRDLDLGENRLSGSVPGEIGQLGNLENLSLSGNFAITGTLPWEMRERVISGELNFARGPTRHTGLGGTHVGGLGGTQISGFAAPPERTESPSFSDNPIVNGNASHSSVAYYQGPLTLERDLGSEPVEFQTPILGRWAMLAVSILHEVPEPPSVITRVLDSNDRILDESLAQAASPITESASDGNWLTEYYFDLPGELFQAGNRIVHVIDPENELAETDEEDNLWEPLVVYGEKPPRLRITFIPLLRTSEEFEWYENIELDPKALMRGILAQLPVADDFEVRIGSAHRVVEDLTGIFSQLNDLWNLHAESNEFFHGLYGRNGGGAALVRGQLAISGFNPHTVIPHEFGHNMSLLHPPGCVAGSIDKNYPYPDGKLGSTVNWNVNWRLFASDADDRFRDLMSYCGEIDSISDYHYRKAWKYWRSFGSESSTGGISTSSVFGAEAELGTIASGANATASTVSEDSASLALSGRVSAGGIWSLTQALLSPRTPRPSAADGEFTLILFDGAGVRVYAEPLAVMRPSDGDESLWAARTPLPVRTARELLILDAQGNEVLRRSLPELE